MLLMACAHDRSTSMREYQVIFNDPTKLYKVDLNKKVIEVYCGELHYTNPVDLTASAYDTIDSAFRSNNMASIRGDHFYKIADKKSSVIPVPMNTVTILKDKKQVSYISIANNATPDAFNDEAAKNAVAFRDVLVGVLEKNKVIKAAMDSIAHYKGKPLL
jgi:hypothetical protein